MTTPLCVVLLESFTPSQRHCSSGLRWTNLSHSAVHYTFSVSVFHGLPLCAHRRMSAATLTKVAAEETDFWQRTLFCFYFSLPRVLTVMCFRLVLTKYADETPFLRSV